MKIALIFCVLIAARTALGSTNLAVETWIHCETGAEGNPAVPTLMSNALYGALGSWVTNVPAVSWSRITNVEKAVTTPITVLGTNYMDTNGTRSLAFNINHPTNLVWLSFNNPSPTVSVCAWMKFASIGTSFSAVDYMHLFDAGGRFAVVQTSASFTLRAHGTTNGTSTFGSDIVIDTNVWYLVTYSPTLGSPGTVNLNCYATDGTLVGTSSAPTDMGNVVAFRFGRIDGTGGARPDDWVIFDDVCVSTNGTFPLGFPWRSTEPVNLAVGASRTTSSLSWSAPTNNGGSTITNYAIWRDGSFLTNNGTATSMVDGVVVNGQSYSYAVNAGNAAGDGQLSSNVLVTIPLPINTSLTGKLTISGKAILK